MSLETAARLHHTIQFLTVVLGLLTAASAVALWFSGGRLEALRSNRDEEERRKHATEDDALRTQLETARNAALSSQRQVDDLKNRREARRFTPDVRKRFASMLRGAGEGAVNLVAVKGDPESVAFARELDGALKEVGWTTSGVKEEILPESPVGLFLVVHSAETAPRWAGPLQQALEAAGHPAQGEAHRERPSGSLTLVIGHRP